MQFTTSFRPTEACPRFIYPVKDSIQPEVGQLGREGLRGRLLPLAAPTVQLEVNCGKPITPYRLNRISVCALLSLQRT